MDQTRLGSLIEALLNVAIGYGVGLAGQIVVFPLVGIQASLGQNLAVSAAFTAISVARTYAVRRWFNARLRAAAHRLAKAAG